MFIPEINTSIKNNSDLISTLALRYSFSPEKSLDLYYSNAAGVQDIGQILKNEGYRFGINLNFVCAKKTNICERLSIAKFD